MTPQANSRLQALRSRAEDMVHTQAGDRWEQTSLQELSHEAMRSMLHELQVHQIELEMQNENLRQTQAELDNARSRYFDLYDLAPVGYCTVGENGLIQEANLTAAALLDVVRSDLVNKPVSRWVVRSDQDTYYNCRKALFDTGTPQDCELQMLKRGGSAFWVHMWVTATQDASGAMVQRMVLSDITERKHLDQALIAKNQELVAARVVAEKASQAKTEFLSNMTHELRTPLNAILGFAQLMDGSTPAPRPEQITNIKQILRAGWYLLDLIGEILDLASIESGQLKLAPAPVLLTEVLQECSTAVAPAAQKANVQLNFGQVDAAVEVHADRARLKQVVTHLLSNAIRYNHAAGSVALTCSVEPQQRLRISVQDTGNGLSADKITQLFQPFNRLVRETSAKAGSGVGLALSKRLVELMDGAIGAHSTVGVGSTFWIELNLCGTSQEGTA